MRMRYRRWRNADLAPGRCLDHGPAPIAVRRCDHGRATPADAGRRRDMVFTDPPYNVNYANSAKDKMRGKAIARSSTTTGDGYDFLLAR